MYIYIITLLVIASLAFNVVEYNKKLKLDTDFAPKYNAGLKLWLPPIGIIASLWFIKYLTLIGLNKYTAVLSFVGMMVGFAFLMAHLMYMLVFFTGIEFMEKKPDSQ